MATNYNGWIKLVFSENVSVISSTLNKAFKCSWQQRDFYGGPLYTNEVVAESAGYAQEASGAAIRNTLIIKLPNTNNFRKAESVVTVTYMPAESPIYGNAEVDSVQAFEISFMPTNIDMWQNIGDYETVKLNTSTNRIIGYQEVASRTVEDYNRDMIKVKSIATIEVIFTPTGTIIP